MVKKQNPLTRIFTSEKIVQRIKLKLPRSFEMAEIESSRAGKVGMEVGVARETILVALLVLIFGKKKVKTDIAIKQHEKDVIVLKKPISVKTVIGSSGIKVLFRHKY